MRRRVIWIVLGFIVALAVAGQLALPRIAEKRIEDRLTANGGTASASVSAFPAVRLLFTDGDRVDVSGSGLHLPLQQDVDGLSKLDGFGRVDIALTDFRAGPFAVARFDLTRDGGAPYHLTTDLTTTAAAMTDYGASRLGLPSGPLFQFFEGQVPGASQPIPVRLDMELRSEDGRVVVVSGGGTIAGIPTGPLAAVLTTAIGLQF